MYKLKFGVILIILFVSAQTFVNAAEKTDKNAKMPDKQDSGVSGIPLLCSKLTCAEAKKLLKKEMSSEKIQQIIGSVSCIRHLNIVYNLADGALTIIYKDDKIDKFIFRNNKVTKVSAKIIELED